MKRKIFQSILVSTALALTTSAHAEVWDVSSLPRYQPQRPVGGVIRMSGSGMAGLVVAWQEGFTIYQPEISFANQLLSSDIAMAAMMPVCMLQNIAQPQRKPRAGE